MNDTIENVHCQLHSQTTDALETQIRNCANMLLKIKRHILTSSFAILAKK